jgi:hypothetical protein
MPRRVGMHFARFLRLFSWGAMEGMEHWRGKVCLGGILFNQPENAGRYT